ncbi:LysE family transporter, partial [Streptomyces sp. NPDC005251]|uniref:LysE family translocator n=1 Tax=unclassified Streptomyces TaxID=2593676 RepID=UPI0033AC011F
MDAQLIAFTGVAAGMVAMPGADFTVVVRNALVSRRAGVACALGITGGLLLHTALAVAGVAAVLTAVPALFRTLQLLGGAYVLHLGLRTLRSLGRPRGVVTDGAGPRPHGVVTGGEGPRLGEVVVEAVGTRPREVVVEAVGTRPR